MKKTNSIAQIYLHQSACTWIDVLFAFATVICAAIFIFNLWFGIPLLACAVCFMLSRSAHVSDKEYDQLLAHALAFNKVREDREEGYETLYKFFVVGYLEKTTFVDFYLQDYDLGKGTVRCGDDKKLRSGFYRLTHLHFADTHCMLYTCEADVIAGTVTSDRRIVPLDADYRIEERTVTVGGKLKKLHYLMLPYCQPIPVQPDSTQLEEILAFFTKNTAKKDTE